MAVFSVPAFNSAVLPTQEAGSVAEHATFDATRPRYTLIVILWLITIPVATIGWLAGLGWAAVKLVEIAGT